MIIYRLAIEIYKDDLSGTGAKLFGGRWNSKGIPVVYCTGNISLAVLEILVKTDLAHIPVSYHLLKLELPFNFAPVIVATSTLKIKWKKDLTYTQSIGDEFAKDNNSLLLQVPSAIVEQENNYILNPRHIFLKKIKILSNKKFQFDKRLYLKNE